MPDDDLFDAVRAAEELEAALGPETRSAAELEADLVALNAALADRERELRAAEARADRAEAEVARAGERLAREATLELERRAGRVLLDMLAVLDDLERALAAARGGGGDPSLLQGIDLVHRRFLAALAAHGVTPIAAAGERFDPGVHEAISVVAATDPGQEGRVIAVLRAGYRIGDRLLRPAGVVVAMAR